MHQRLRRAVVVALAMTLPLTSVAIAHPERSSEHRPAGRHEPADQPEGRLSGKIENVELVGQVTVKDAGRGRIADVGAFGNYAYLAAFGQPVCENGGVYVIDISDPTSPKEVGFIKTAAGSFVGEGVQLLDVENSNFDGQILIHNNETCADPGQGGLSLIDVTDPLNPKPLVQHFGDTTGDGTDPNATTPVHEIHSAFGWNDGDNTYVVMVDDMERATLDIDIVDITDPAHPTLVKETGLVDFPQAEQDPPPDGDTNFFHDVIVKEVGGHMLMLASYWDAGYVILNVDDPANPTFLRDSDFADTEPFADRLGQPEGFIAEGNAHQAEFSHDNEFFLGQDEDFAPFRIRGEITSGPAAGTSFDVLLGRSVGSVPDEGLEGRTAFVGQACDPLGDVGGQAVIALIERGTCPFQQKADNVKAAGYVAGVVFNSQQPECEALATMAVETDLPFVFTARSAGLRILGIDTTDPCAAAAPVAGAPSENVALNSVFDGWGYVHLFDAETMEDLDQYAIEEALDPAFAKGFGDLSVHEVAVDPEENLAYFSYYSGGFRVVSFDEDGITEVGAYIDPERGNNLWGVQVHEVDGEQYVLASDRDTGLWIFRYTPDLDLPILDEEDLLP